MQLYIVGVPQVERSNKLVGSANEVVYLAFKHGHTRENKMPLVWVFY